MKANLCILLKLRPFISSTMNTEQRHQPRRANSKGHDLQQKLNLRSYWTYISRLVTAFTPDHIGNCKENFRPLTLNPFILPCFSHLVAASAHPPQQHLRCYRRGLTVSRSISRHLSGRRLRQTAYSPQRNSCFFFLSNRYQLAEPD